MIAVYTASRSTCLRRVELLLKLIDPVNYQISKVHRPSMLGNTGMKSP